MVSVRKPGRQNKSILTFRNLLIGFILLQTLNLTVKLVRHANIDEQKGVKKVDGFVRKKDDLKHSVPENHAEEDRQHHLEHTDTDDHVMKHFDELHKEKEPESPADPSEKEEEKEESASEATEKKEEEDAASEATEKKSSETKSKKSQEKPLDASTEKVLAKTGSGAITQVGYVVDMVDERAHPQFRSLPEPPKVDVSSMVDGVSLEPCEEFETNQVAVATKCLQNDATMYANNPGTDTKHLCGQELPPQKLFKLSEACAEPAHFLVDGASAIPLDGHGMPPIQVMASQLTPNGLKFDDIECDIPCQYESDTKIDGEVSSFFVAGTDWKLIQTYADPYFVGQVKMERTDFKKSIFYSTTSLQSSVPLSFYNHSLHSIRDRPALDFDTAKPQLANFMDTECGMRPRAKWLESLKAAGNTVKNYGSCSHDTEPSADIHTLEGRLAVAKESRFVLIWERGTEKDHLTTLTYEALLSGAVPLIYGASNTASILPPDSAIFMSDYNNWDTFSEHVKQVGEDKKLWEKYQAWRKDEAAITAYEERLRFAGTDARCRTCRWAYSKIYGLGWNHSQQVIQDNVISGKELCTNSKNTVTHPFVEEWVQVGTKIESPTDRDNCKEPSVTGSLDLEGYKIKRSVYRHDGVTDLVIEEIERDSNEDVVLLLKFDAHNTEGAYFRDTHTMVSTTNRSRYISSATIQDERVKATVLANWETEIHSPEEGAIQIAIQWGSDTKLRLPVRLRVITENTNTLHDKMTEFHPSPFGERAIKDFVDPVQMFVTA